MEKLKEFRFNKDKENRALVIKVDKEKLLVDVEHYVCPLNSMEDLVEVLPETAPRFVLLQFEYHSLDGRIAYPHVFIYYSPPGVRTDIHMLYASVETNVQRATESSRAFELDDLEELSSEWVTSRLRETLTRA